MTTQIYSSMYVSLIEKDIADVPLINIYEYVVSNGKIKDTPASDKLVRKHDKYYYTVSL